MSTHNFKNTQIERIVSSLRAVKEHEGEGRILHDSYTKKRYRERRHMFLSKHPDFKDDLKRLSIVAREADQVFHEQADELSVEQVRRRELACEFAILLKYPTSTNTDTLDDFRSYGTKEWTAETGHPIPAPFTPSPPSSPRTFVKEPSVEDLVIPEQNLILTSEARQFFSGARISESSAGRTTRQAPQTVFAGADPEYSGQQTATNTSSQHPFNNIFTRNATLPMSTAMDVPRIALNAPENRETLRKIISDLGKTGLLPSDAPLQYQILARKQQQTPQQQTPQQQTPEHQQQNRPQMQVSAVKGRGLTTPVKFQSNAGKKRTAPVDLDEADPEPDSSEEVQATTQEPAKRGQPAVKKAKVTVTVTAGEDAEVPAQEARRPAEKQPRNFSQAVEAAGPELPTKQPRRHVTKQPREVPATIPAAPKPAIKIKPQAAQNTSSVASTASDMIATRGSRARPTSGGKAPPEQSGSGTPAEVPRRASHPATVSGARIARTKTEASEAATERQQALYTELISRKPNARHPDLGPEFFNINNFTADEQDPDGGPVRCVCGVTTDDGKYAGDWIGCDKGECHVWQHVECMGDAVPPAAKRETSKYLCQQCDPWAHRKLIAKLRRENPIPGVAGG